MRNLKFGEAIDDALGAAMARDPSIVFFGEDVEGLHVGLFVRFGPRRVRNTPISESAFVGAAVTAAMAGLRPVVEVMMADFLGVAMDALLNHAAKVNAFSGGQWDVPLVIRTGCGGGYGDGGQHGQALWGWLAHIPGLSVVVPSTPADAGGLLLAALGQRGPVVFMEHKLLSELWLEPLGRGGRPLQFDVPPEGAAGPVPDAWEPLALGRAAVRRVGGDVTIAGAGVAVHRALEAAGVLAREGIAAEVIDLRSVAPLDREAVAHSVRKTQRLLVVDEDYRDYGLSGELAATVLEAGVRSAFARVCTRDTIPFARAREDRALPNCAAIVEQARRLVAVPPDATPRAD